MRRLVSLALAALGVIGIVLALPARPASAHPAHPLGNFSVNQAIGLDLYPDRVTVTAAAILAILLVQFLLTYIGPRQILWLTAAPLDPPHSQPTRK